MKDNSQLLYPLLKMLLGVVCLVLSVEYGYAYCVYEAASFGILYIADMITWLLAGAILFTEGLQGYLIFLKKGIENEKKELIITSHASSG